jgi:hypothetical protein
VVQRLSAAMETHLFFRLSLLLAVAVLGVTHKQTHLEGLEVLAVAAVQIHRLAALEHQRKVLQVVLAHLH